MLKPKEIAEISLVLWYLPLDRVEQIKKLVLSMKKECGYNEPVDDSDEWTDEDRQEWTQASMRRLEEEDPSPEEPAAEEEPGDAQPR